MKKKRLIYIAIGVLVLLMSGCAGLTGTVTDSDEMRLKTRIFTDKGMTKIEEQDPDWLETGDFTYSASEHAYIHLFIDGSTSMKGYTIPSDSIYDRITISLNSVAANTFSSVTLDVYKFFDQVYMMKDKDRNFRPVGEKYVDFVHRTDFYGTEVGVKSGEVRSANRDRSDFGQVLDAMQTISPKIGRPNADEDINDLFIIVSDFIPQDNRDTDFYRFTSRLYGEVLKNDLCCGIAAFQAEFEGNLQGNDKKYLQRSYAYNGKLPFYVIVVGQTANVSKFMDELDRTVRYQDISEEDYGLLILDGQAPMNTGSGNVSDIVWHTDTDMRLINENGVDINRLVSKELLENSTKIVDKAYLNQHVFSVFPTDQYSGGQQTVAGEITYALPYQIAPTSNIAIENDKWSIELNHTMLQGELEIDPDEIVRLDRQCSSKIVFPLDMSEQAFNQVYGVGVPKPEPWESGEDVQARVWRERREAYEAAVSARMVCEDEQAIQLGEPYVVCGEVHIPFTLDIHKLTAETSYLYSIDLSARPEISAKPMPDWVYGWNVDDEEVEIWAKNPKAFENAGTPKLTNAIKALQGNRIYDEGMFVRQINLIFAKSEVLIPEAIRTELIAEGEAQASESENDMVSQKKSSSSSNNPIPIFNIFKRGEK